MKSIQKYYLKFWLIIFALMITTSNICLLHAMGETPQKEPLDPYKVMTFYYTHPIPHDALFALFALDKSGFFESETARDYDGPNSSLEGLFIAIFKTKPNLLDGFPFDAVNWQNIVNNDLSPKARELVLSAYKKRNIDLLKEPADSPAALDRLWGAFIGSGDTQYVGPIVDAVDKYDNKDNKQDRSLGGVAIWSLTENSKMHKKVFEYCEKLIPQLTDRKKELLSEIIKNAKNNKTFTPDGFK